VSHSSTRKVGVAIIGGGIIGLSIAHYLSKRGFVDVEVIERDDQLALHASGHNAGGIAGLHIETQEELRPLFKATPGLYSDLLATPGFQFDYEVNGTISYVSPKEVADIEDALSEENDAHAELLDSTELLEKEPNLSTQEFQFGLFHPDDAQGNSKKLVQCLARACMVRGIKITTGAEVISSTIDRNKISEIETTRGTLRPETLVIAAGPWSSEVAFKVSGLELPVKPIKGYLIETEASKTRIVRSFIDGPNYYAMQTLPGGLVIGGGIDDVGFDTSLDETRLTEAWQEVTRFIPSVSSLKQVSKISCFRPYATGGLPIIGRSKKFENLVLATGHYRNGFALGPVTGVIVSELLLDGGTKFEINAFSPDRY
jgi:glycine oxidase